MLGRFWLVVSEELKAFGGACLISEMAESVRRRMAWDETPQIDALEWVLELRDDLVIDKSQSVVLSNKVDCVNCKIALEVLQALFNEGSDDKSVAEVSDCIKSSCRQQPECKAKYYNIKFSEGYISVIARKTTNIMVRDGVVFYVDSDDTRRGSRLHLVESIVKSAGRAIHISEIYKEAKQQLPDNQRITMRIVHSWLDRSNKLLLWDRGTYIHRNYVTIPEFLIAEIEKWIFEKLKSGVPFFSVAGAWAEFEKLLVANGIPSEYSLYSCLRNSNREGLCYPRYPYVMIDSPESERLPPYIALEQFVLEQGGLVSTKEIKNYAVNELGISAQIFQNHMVNVPNVIRAVEECTFMWII